MSVKLDIYMYLSWASDYVRVLLIRADLSSSARWLQMPWHQIGAKPSATIIVSLQWLNSGDNVTWITSHNTNVAFFPLDKPFPRLLGSSPSRWILIHITGSYSHSDKVKCDVKWFIINVSDEVSLIPPRISLGMRPANERRCYIVMMSLIDWTHT